MNFEVYCDEAYTDLLSSRTPEARYLTIGSLWLIGELRDKIKAEIKKIREKHDVWGEIKWSKISPSRLEFYLDLIELFMDYDTDHVQFRCIAVDRTKLNCVIYNGDYELGFYKFYYQLLRHQIFSHNTYRVFCDIKSNRGNQRLQTLMRALNNANFLANIECVQALPSKEVVLIQLADLLLGSASSRLNNTLSKGTAKECVVKSLEKRLGRTLAPTNHDERKFNLFEFKLQGER